MANLPPEENTNSICNNIATACAICFGRKGGGRNPIDGELLPYGILSGGRKSMGGSHVTQDSPYSGNMMYPTKKINSIQL